jgi:hypothetical protein
MDVLQRDPQLEERLTSCARHRSRLNARRNFLDVFKSRRLRRRLPLPPVGLRPGGDGLLRHRERPSAELSFSFIETEKANYPVALLCKTLGVSVSMSGVTIRPTRRPVPGPTPSFGSGSWPSSG